MAKVLIVDDEKNVVNVIKEYCEYNGFETDCAFNGLEALEKVKINTYDCVVMDIMMPVMSGYEAVVEMRKFKDVPILLCSAKVEECDRLKGFELGVDDYIMKPFSPREVVARIKAVTKRASAPLTHDTIIVGDVVIDLSAHVVMVKNGIVQLTNKEWELLVLLAKNGTKYTSRNEIVQMVWGGALPKDPRTIDTHIKMLRRDLKDCGVYIKTVRKEGYKFEA